MIINFGYATLVVNLRARGDVSARRVFIGFAWWSDYGFAVRREKRAQIKS